MGEGRRPPCTGHAPHEASLQMLASHCWFMSNCHFSILSVNSWEGLSAPTVTGTWCVCQLSVPDEAMSQRQNLLSFHGIIISHFLPETGYAML